MENKNEKIIKNVKASMQFEDCILQENDINLLNSFLNNEITEAQGIDIIKNEYLSMR